MGAARASWRSGFEAAGEIIGKEGSSKGGEGEWCVCACGQPDGSGGSRRGFNERNLDWYLAEGTWGRDRDSSSNTGGRTTAIATAAQQCSSAAVQQRDPYGKTSHELASGRVGPGNSWATQQRAKQRTSGRPGFDTAPFVRIALPDWSVASPSSPWPRLNGATSCPGAMLTPEGPAACWALRRAC